MPRRLKKKPFIDSLNILSIYYMPDIILGTRDMVEKRGNFSFIHFMVLIENEKT